MVQYLVPVAPPPILASRVYNSDLKPPMAQIIGIIVHGRRDTAK